MPERRRSLGVSMAPAARITSFEARTRAMSADTQVEMKQEGARANRACHLSAGRR
jgi:hypothetical protein